MLQIGSKVEDLEEFTIVPVPQQQILLPAVLVPFQNLSQASVLSDPAQDPVPIPRQCHIPVPIPAQIPIISVQYPLPTTVAYHPLVLQRSPHLLDLYTLTIPILTKDLIKGHLIQQYSQK